MREVMPHVHDEYSVDTLWAEPWSRGRSLYGSQIGERLESRTAVHEAHHVRLEIRRDHLAARQGAGQPHRKVPRARAHIGDGHPGLEFQRAEDIVGPLPAVARRVVEYPCPRVSVDERVFTRALAASAVPVIVSA